MPLMLDVSRRSQHRSLNTGRFNHQPTPGTSEGTSKTMYNANTNARTCK